MQEINEYLKLKKSQSQELDNFPMFFAFNNDQLEQGLEKFKLTIDDTNKLYSIGGGGYILKTDSKKLNDMFNKQSKKMNQAIKNDKTGENFIFQMFDYELSNHVPANDIS